MNDLYSYIVQSGINLAVLFGIYWFFLSRDTFYKIHRFYLLLSLVISVLMPLITISIPQNSGFDYVHVLQPVVISPDFVAHGMDQNITFGQIFITLYLTGSGFLFLRFVFRGIRTALLIRKYGIRRINGIKLVVTDKKFVPFSIFDFIVIHQSVLDDPEFEKIMEHEQTHVLQKHTLDLILIEFIQIFQWFNPVIWLYRKSIVSVHEFLADDRVLSKGFKRLEYQQLLLNQTLGAQFTSLSNNFNHSLIKKRFIMMSKEKTKRISLLKMVFIVPAAFMFTLLFTLSFAENSIAQANSQTTTAVEKSEGADVVKQQNNQEEPVFTVVEQMPSFPGGDEARVKYMVSNIKYPENARKNGIQGKVFVTFVVEKSGKITDIRVLKSVDEELDKESVRVISEMPKWKPGMDGGKPVRVQFNMPIDYKLDSGKKNETELRENKKTYEEIKKD